MIIQCEICGVGGKHTDWCPTGKAIVRAEAAEAQRDTAWTELCEIRRLIDADENEATVDEVTRKLYRLSKDAHDAEQERDTLRAARDVLLNQLEQAQRKIAALSTQLGSPVHP